MRYLISTLFLAFLIFLFSFHPQRELRTINNKPVVTEVITLSDASIKNKIKDDETGVLATGFVEYAKTLIGTPYAYGSVNPYVGLDCSGFVNYVSNHFGIKLPRSSFDFTNVGTTVETNNAKPGDLILFTGTDPGKHIVGHIGIITGNHDSQLQFIHSSSGKSKGVTINELSGYYKSRFVKIIRIFPLAADRVVS